MKSIGAAGDQRARKRPATYPPQPKLNRAANSRKSPESSASAAEASLHVGDVETIDRPIADPNAISTNDNAEATSAPAMTAPHCKKNVGLSTGTVTTRSDVSTRLSVPGAATISEGRKRTEWRGSPRLDRQGKLSRSQFPPRLALSLTEALQRTFRDNPPVDLERLTAFSVVWKSLRVDYALPALLLQYEEKRFGFGIPRRRIPRP